MLHKGCKAKLVIASSKSIAEGSNPCLMKLTSCQARQGPSSRTRNAHAPRLVDCGSLVLATQACTAGRHLCTWLYCGLADWRPPSQHLLLPPQLLSSKCKKDSAHSAICSTCIHLEPSLPPLARCLRMKLRLAGPQVRCHPACRIGFVGNPGAELPQILSSFDSLGRSLLVVDPTGPVRHIETS